jgi:hypothetical protein
MYTLCHYWLAGVLTLACAAFRYNVDMCHTGV